MHFDARATQAPETCKVLRALFGPIHPYFMFPHVIPIRAGP